MWDSSMYNNSNANGGFFNDTNRVEDTPGKKQARRLQSVVPTVIRQIRDCEDEEFTLFGMPTQILSVVGIVTDYEVQTTKAIYNIKDHTGTIKAIWWLESDLGDQTPTLPPVKENAYVHLFGSIRIQDNEKMLMVLKMLLVDDANVITTHLLEVIHTRLEAEAMLNNPAGSSSIIKKNNPGAELATSMAFYDNNVQQDNNGMSPIQTKVYELLQKAPQIDGISKQTILRTLSSYKQREVLDALEFLINEGHAYSTIDSEHYTATSSY